MSADPSSTSTRWFLLYRGPLASCNYGCDYCPFAKSRHTREELAHDRNCLERFVKWVEGRHESIGILFTPWGEALVHRSYQQAMVRLSHLPHVWKVAAQTNLSFPLGWLTDACRETLALWCTFHPTETPLPRFAAQAGRLKELGIRHSVGVVGRREAMADIAALRALIAPEIYVWVNAWKREQPYYAEDDLARLLRMDPLFAFNLRPHPSLGRACRAGSEAFTVDGTGAMRRCHFIPGIIGNIYEPGFEKKLLPTACTNAECRCHIGYVHLPELGQDEIYGDGLLERVPARWPLSA